VDLSSSVDDRVHMYVAESAASDSHPTCSYPSPLDIQRHETMRHDMSTLHTNPSRNLAYTQSAYQESSYQDLFQELGRTETFLGGFIQISTLSVLGVSKGWAQTLNDLGQRIGCTGSRCNALRSATTPGCDFHLAHDKGVPRIGRHKNQMVWSKPCLAQVSLVGS